MRVVVAFFTGLAPPKFGLVHRPRYGWEGGGEGLRDTGFRALVYRKTAFPTRVCRVVCRQSIRSNATNGGLGTGCGSPVCLDVFVQVRWGILKISARKWLALNRDAPSKVVNRGECHCGSSWSSSNW